MKSLTLLSLLLLLLLQPIVWAADGTLEGAVSNPNGQASKPGTTIRETDSTFVLTPIESVSMNQTTTWQDNRLRAYYSPSTLNVNGFLLFDVTQIPDNAIITSMTLRCYLENAYSSPYANPIVDVYYCGNDNWTRMTATPGSISLDALLANNVPFSGYVTYYDFTLNVAAHNWSGDLHDNHITIGFKDDVSYYSYVYFYGAYGSPTGPAPQLTIVTTASPRLDITLTPINPPIVIPPGGGTFNFSASLVNHGPNQVPFVAWGGIRYPNGTFQLTLGPTPPVNPPVGIVVSRNRTQNVPGTWPPGVYTYIGYVALAYPGPIIDSSYFTWTIQGGAYTGPIVWDASCTGEPFPGEALSSQPTAFSLVTVTPNPFNPSTAISYELRAASLVSLKVYDTAGRLVTTLVNGLTEAGRHEVTFDGSKLTSGMYLYKLQGGGKAATGKMMLVK